MQNEEQKYLTIADTKAWSQGFNDKINIRADGSLALWSIPDLEQIIDLPNADVKPVGLAFHKPEVIFVVDQNHGYLFELNTVTHQIRRIPCFDANDKIFNLAGGMASSADMLYVVDSEKHRVVALFLPNFQIRFIIGAIDQWNQPVPSNDPGALNTPMDVAIDRQGNIYVLDQGNQRIQKFNQHGQFVWQAGQNELNHPIQLALDSRDYIYVLDDDLLSVLKFDSNGEFIERLIDLRLIPDIKPSGLAVDSEYKIYVGERGSKDNLKVHVFDEQGLYLGGCAGYRGPCNCLTVDDQDNLYVGYQADDGGHLAILKSGQRYLQHGTYYSNKFDSFLPDCRWHRLTLDADIPAKTRIEIFYFMSNHDKTLAEIQTLPTTSWRGPIISPMDALFQSGDGRYLWLKIVLSGDELHTPQLRRLTVYFPRISYLRYLPAIYQEDEVSRDFMERFLSVFETFFADTELLIASLARYVDPLATDSEFLPWLASWLVIAVDENWDEPKQRQLIKNAFQLYQTKGTAEGLAAMIELYLGTQPKIIEHFRYLSPMIIGRQAQLGAHTILGTRPKKQLQIDQTSVIGEFAVRETEPGGEEPFLSFAYDFTVVVRLADESQLSTLQRLIDEEKPAHTRYCLKVVSSEMRIGIDSYIEIGTRVAAGPSGTKIGIHSRLNKDAILKSTESMKGKIEITSQVQINSILN